MSKINWQEIEAEYVSTNISYTAIADKYKVAKSRVAQVGKSQNWVEKRNAYRTNVAQSALQNARISNIKKNTDKINNLINAADKMTAFLNEIMDDRESFYLQILKNDDGGEEIKQGAKPDTKAVRDIVTSITGMTAAVKELNEMIDDGKDKDDGIKVKLIEGKAEWAK